MRHDDRKPDRGALIGVVILLAASAVAIAVLVGIANGVGQ